MTPRSPTRDLWPLVRFDPPQSRSPGCGISNDGLAHLVGLTSLRALRLSGKNNATQVDDQGMAHIGKLTGLKALLLDYLFISEEGLGQLKDCRNSRRFIWPGPWPVTRRQAC
ncbi:MAG: hypothetical protein Ct9H300mP1_30410 [Planctomycetaceae bacterium]|nr:MAG: hypothetical protein Ct9H300mP1_30410 [Planctomycetaceae bacterium]